METEIGIRELRQIKLTGERFEGIYRRFSSLYCLFLDGKADRSCFDAIRDEICEEIKAYDAVCSENGKFKSFQAGARRLLVDMLGRLSEVDYDKYRIAGDEFLLSCYMLSELCETTIYDCGNEV